MKRFYCIACFSILILLMDPVPARAHTPVAARHGMVVSESELASAIGRDILRQGGNAVDAAVAVGFALAVTAPWAGNIGGGGFMLVRMADGRVVAIDYRETAPLKATRDMYLDTAGNVVPDLSLIGPKSAGVPGTVAGLSLALKEYGTMDLPTVMKPAIELARNGFLIAGYLPAEMSAENKEWLDYFARYPSTARIFLKDGQPYLPGDTLRQADLAKTLGLIATEGPDAFYRGAIADLIERAMRNDGGLITMEDLAMYQPVIRQPLVTSYRGYTVYTMPPPSSGGVILTGLLHVLEPDSIAGWGHNSSQYIHRFSEACNRFYADRAFFMGDPDFVDVPVAGLTSREYAAKLRALIDPNRHTPSQEVLHGDSLWMANIGAQHKESKQTTHYSVVDQWGNAVSNTYTLNGGFGSVYVVDGTGMLLNNEMDDFSIKAGAPNQFGLVGGTANAIEPRKRMLSSMTPTIITKDDRPFLVVGSPGGSTIITVVAQVILNVIDHGMNVQDAVIAPRVHSQWLPDEVDVEPLGVPRDVVESLTSKGHVVTSQYFLGRVHAILVDTKRGLLYGATDPRGFSSALGY